MAGKGPRLNASLLTAMLFFLTAAVAWWTSPGDFVFPLVWTTLALVFAGIGVREQRRRHGR